MHNELVRSIPLFSQLGRRDHRAIARLADVVDVPAGKTLASEDDFAAEFFVILDGVAIVSREGLSFATLGAGDFFGEIGLLDGPQRSATVTAATPMQLVVLGSREFASLLTAYPAIAERIREAAADRLASTSLAAA